MIDTNSAVLTNAEREQFVTQGYVVLRGAFDGEASKAWVRDECARTGVDLGDPATWKQAYFRLSTERRESLETFAPRAWQASCELMGGEDRVRHKAGISLFAINLSQGADKPWTPPSPTAPGWHKDGWHFRHFLDSPEQGLLGIPCLTDVVAQGGATFIASGSVAPVARFLAAHPEGVLPDDFPVRELLSDPGVTFLEATGAAGDFYLLHPYLLHAVSQNRVRAPRAISNILYELTEPMQLDRPTDDYSPVEQAILHGLGAERFAFAPTAPRYKTPDGGPISQKYK